MALTNDVSGAVFEDLSEVVVELVFDRFDERYAFDQRRARLALEEANGVLSVMDASMKIIDYARVYHGAQSSQLTEFEVVAKRGDVNLVPRSAVTIPFVAETFRAHVREELAGDAIFEYEWSTSGLHGTLSDSRGGNRCRVLQQLRHGQLHQQRADRGTGDRVNPRRSLSSGSHATARARRHGHVHTHVGAE